MKTNLEKKTKTQLWIMMCNFDIVSGDVSLYRMRGWTKSDMIEAIEKHMEDNQ